jgi:hypothetical protein
MRSIQIALWFDIAGSFVLNREEFLSYLRARKTVAADLGDSVNDKVNPLAFERVRYQKAIRLSI